MNDVNGNYGGPGCASGNEIREFKATAEWASAGDPNLYIVGMEEGNLVIRGGGKEVELKIVKFVILTKFEEDLKIIVHVRFRFIVYRVYYS